MWTSRTTSSSCSPNADRARNTTLKLTREVAEDVGTFKPQVNGLVLYINRLLADSRVEHVDVSDRMHH